MDVRYSIKILCAHILKKPQTVIWKMKNGRFKPQSCVVCKYYRKWIVIIQEVNLINLEI